MDVGTIDMRGPDGTHVSKQVTAVPYHNHCWYMYRGSNSVRSYEKRMHCQLRFLDTLYTIFNISDSVSDLVFMYISSNIYHFRYKVFTGIYFEMTFTWSLIVTTEGVIFLDIILYIFFQFSLLCYQYNHRWHKGCVKCVPLKLIFINLHIVLTALVLLMVRLYP